MAVGGKKAQCVSGGAWLNATRLQSACQLRRIVLRCCRMEIARSKSARLMNNSSFVCAGCEISSARWIDCQTNLVGIEWRPDLSPPNVTAARTGRCRSLGARAGSARKSAHRCVDSAVKTGTRRPVESVLWHESTPRSAPSRLNKFAY